MAGRNLKKNELVAEVVTGNSIPCAFCCRNADDELNYGKIYSIGDIQCHYFCALLSCCLVQKAADNVGLFGFLYTDILAEIERAKKHKCSYCQRYGANLGCSYSQCRKQFHLPCGLERSSVSLFYGNYKSYCLRHAPKQSIPSNIMAKASLRKKFLANGGRKTKPTVLDEDQSAELEAVCVICYEEVPGFPSTNTFWPPCCAKDAWFHRNCLQRMALSAGMHYLKCPLCNDKEVFYKAVISQGYYVPDRDAAWELEQNAFAEIYERPVTCSAETCQCPLGRSHDSDNGSWDIKLCILCGSSGVHVECLDGSEAPASGGRFVCPTCRPAAPDDLDSLAESIDAVILAEQEQNAANTRPRPVMPSRMSLRRTKYNLRVNTASSSSLSSSITQNQEPLSTTQSRLELNLKPPKRHLSSPLEPKSPLKDKQPSSLTPTKLLEQTFHERLKFMNVSGELDENVLERIKRKLSEPKPMSAKRSMINKILDEYMDSVVKGDAKHKEPLKEWCSPRKCAEIMEDAVEISEECHQDAEPDHQTESQIEDLRESDSKKDNQLNKDDEEQVPSGDLVVNENLDSNIENCETERDNIVDLNINIEEDVNNIDDKLSNKHNTDLPILDNLDDEHLESTIHVEEQPNLERCEQPEIFKTSKPDSTETDVLNETAEIGTDIRDHESPQNISDEDLKFSTAKNLKTLDIENDSSVEISTGNLTVNIDVVKMENVNTDFKMETLKSPVKSKKCFFKFSPTDKEILLNSNFNLDLESFKNHYLSEVDVERSPNVLNTMVIIPTKNLRKRKFITPETLKSRKYRSAPKSKKQKIDCATKIGPNTNFVPSNVLNDIKIENVKDNHDTDDVIGIKDDEITPNLNQDSTVTEKTSRRAKRRKRKTIFTRKKKHSKKSADAGDVSNKTKASERRICRSTRDGSSSNSDGRVLKKSNTRFKLRLENRENVRVAIDTKKSSKDKNLKTKLSIKNKNMELKIRWKRELFKLKFVENKKKRKAERSKRCLKQYILKCKDGDDNIIAKPDTDVTPMKRKYMKQEKSLDKLVQTSIVSFFKKLP